MALLTNISTPSVTLSWDGVSQFDATTSITVPAGAVYLVVRTTSTGAGPNTFTYNGVALTQAENKSNSNSGYAGLYYLANPSIGTFDLFIAKSSGATYQLVIDSVSGASSVGGAVSFGAYDTNRSMDVTTVSGDLVLDSLYVPQTVTAGAGQTTQLLNTNNASASSETATGTTTTMSWTQPADFVAQVAVAFSSGAAPMSITDVDSDNIITNGQTGIVITGVGFEASQNSGTVTIDGVTQTVTAWADTAITITHVRSSMKYGAQTLSVTNNSAANDTQPITVNPASGFSYVNLSGYAAVSADITGTPSLVDGDQLEYENTAGSFSVAISADGLVTLTGADSPSTETFDVSAWDATGGSWGTSGTYSLQDTVAPVLSSTTGTTTGATTATGTVDTDEGNGDIYWLADTSDSTNQATVLSTGATQAVSGTGTQIVSATSLTASTGYYFHFVQKDAAGNDSAVAHSPLFTTFSSTAPTLQTGQGNPFLPVFSASGSVLTLTFSEAVTTSVATGLTLSTGEVLTYSSGSTTDTIVYDVFPYAQAGGAILNFAGGANLIESTASGADVEAFSDVIVNGINTASPPVLVGTPSINSTGTLLTFSFDDSLDNLTTPVASPFSLAGGAYTFTSSSLVGTGASFAISPAVQQGDVLTLSFVEAANTFTSVTSGIAVESFSGVAITNNSTDVSVPPVFTSAPAVSKTTLTGHTIRQTIDKTGTVYGVRLASGADRPTPQNVKDGDGGSGASLEATSVAATADNPCVLTFSGGAKNTEYDYYIVAEDSVPNLQEVVVKVTATTENLIFNGSGGGGLPAAGPKKKVKMKWEESKRKGKK